MSLFLLFVFVYFLYFAFNQFKHAYFVVFIQLFLNIKITKYFLILDKIGWVQADIVIDYFLIIDFFILLNINWFLINVQYFSWAQNAYVKKVKFPVLCGVYLVVIVDR